MPLDIPLPTASPDDDPAQYIPLLLSAIEGFLLARDVWAEADYDDARLYMEQLMSYIVELIGDDALGRPVGNITMWGSGTFPDGWLRCNGDAVSRADYSRLFAVIGTTFGVGDGSTTFNLPNFKDHSPGGVGDVWGSGLASTDGELNHTLTTSELPSHNHLQQVGSASAYLGTGGTGRSAYSAVTTSSTTRVHTDNEGAGTPHNTLHPVLMIHFIIYTGV